MKISIVTPTYNSEKYVRQTLDSIHNQSYKNIEHIVVDGLSTDRTLEIVKSYPQIEWISEKDNGQSEAINKGLRRATGDILAWQNADDIYCEDAIQTVVDFFTKRPEVDVVYGYYQLMDSESNWINDVYPIEWSRWRFAHGRFVPLQPTVFWRKEVTERVGLLDEKLHYCMDVDFFAKAVKHGFCFARIPSILGAFRVHDQSKTQNKLNEKKVSAEYKSVLVSHFNYRWFDFILFDFFKWRAKLGKYIKIKLFKSRN
jgi:glycosyltransferase involved in cell wall biosynthesis